MTDYTLPADIAALAERVVAENLKIGRRVAVAESCTGGLVCAALTEIAGSSKVLDRGFITYSNEAKVEQLNVPMDLIESLGAVSVATAWAMAEGALRNSNADVAVAISGIAGPDGGSALKPVGTVVFARALRSPEKSNENADLENAIDAEERHFAAVSRADVRRQATVVALELLLP